MTSSVDTREVLRESHPVRSGAVLVGAIGGGLWLMAFGLMSRTLAGYVWWTIAAGLLAWLAAYALAVRGDRGVAVGVAAATGVAWTVAMLSLIAEWITRSAWPL